MKKLGRYITGFGVGAGLLAGTIFGTSCTMNLAMPGIGVSLGTDASGVEVDKTGKTKINQPNNPTFIGPPYYNGYNPYYPYYYRSGRRIYNAPNVWYSPIPLSNEFRSTTMGTRNGAISRGRSVR